MVVVFTGAFVVCFVVWTLFAAFAPVGFRTPFRYEESCRRKLTSSVSLNGAFFVDGAKTGIGDELIFFVVVVDSKVGIWGGLIFIVDVGISSISADEYSSELQGIVDVLILVEVFVVLSIVFNVDAMSNNFEFAFTKVEMEADGGESETVLG